MPAGRRDYVMLPVLAAAKAGGSVGRTEDFPHADSRVSVARRTAKPIPTGTETGRASMTVHDSPSPSGGLVFSARTGAGYAIASLAGELDVACAPVLREQLAGLLRPRASKLVIDLSKVSFCDVSGLAVLVGTGRRARTLGGVLRLAAPAPAVASALRLSGLLWQFDVFPTVVAATRDSPGPERRHTHAARLAVMGSRARRHSPG
jgi:anti-sigma B factor antagonist